MTLTEAKEEMKKLATKRRRVIYKGEPAILSTVGIAWIGIIMQSELDIVKEIPAYTIKFTLALPIELEFEGEQA